MNRRQYLDQALRLYGEAPDAPARPTRSDWAIAGDLYRRGVDLDHLAHAIRIATLRRRSRQPPSNDTVHSLAYYRAVLLALTTDELEPDYVDYVRRRYQDLLPERSSKKPRTHRRNLALSGSQ